MPDLSKLSQCQALSLCFLHQFIFRLCGPGTTSKLPNFCNPKIGDEWVDGYNSDVKDVLGTGGL